MFGDDVELPLPWLPMVGDSWIGLIMPSHDIDICLTHPSSRLPFAALLASVIRIPASGSDVERRTGLAVRSRDRPRLQERRLLYLNPRSSVALYQIPCRPGVRQGPRRLGFAQCEFHHALHVLAAFDVADQGSIEYPLDQSLRNQLVYDPVENDPLNVGVGQCGTPRTEYERGRRRLSPASASFAGQAAP